MTGKLKKLILALLTVITVTTVLVACNHNDEPDPVQEEDLRTVLVYIAADNTLTSFAADDVAEMVSGFAAVDADKNNLLVYVDTQSAKPLLYQITKDSKGAVVKNILHEYEEQNSVYPTVMAEVYNRVFSAFPAKSYGLVLWSHGDGWLPSPSNISASKASTRWFGQDGTSYMDISSLNTALNSAPHFDFILFDACFMQSVEVAYELKDRADYFIGAPNEIPGPGAYYTELVPAMFSQANDLASTVAHGYYDYYAAKYTGQLGSNENWTMGVTVSVLKSSEVQALAAATAAILPKYITNGSAINVSSIYSYDPRSTYYYYDLKGLVQSLTSSDDQTLFSAWSDAFELAVPLHLTTDKTYSALKDYNIGGMVSMLGSSGLSSYVPRSGTYSYDRYLYSYASLNTFYHSYAWYSAAGWSNTGW
ncbi:MAG: clostripain-related cysteine peptidase [Bacteroides graminisolvens]|nr:clostripain-related cysteine peptidase [Bacteroides graminisolvens]MCD8571991.1 clostripain-related cysteine peptidase [Bacteroides graminisolvens]